MKSTTTAPFESSLARRPSCNRILIIAVASGRGDTPSWPKWKFAQMCASHDVQDVALLCVTDTEAFIGRIDGCTHWTKNLRKDRVHALDLQLIAGFLEQYYLPKQSWLVYGGHGCSDFINVHHAQHAQANDGYLPMYHFARCFNGKQFIGIVFDSCLMSSLDAAYFLRFNAPYIGASEGYIMEEDTWVEHHFFGVRAARALSLYPADQALPTLQRLGQEYCARNEKAQFTVMDTKQSAPLWDYVQEKYVRRWIERCPLKPEVAAGTAPIHDRLHPHMASFNEGGGEVALPHLSVSPLNNNDSNTGFNSRSTSPTGTNDMSFSHFSRNDNASPSSPAAVLGAFSSGNPTPVKRTNDEVVFSPIGKANGEAFTPERQPTTEEQEKEFFGIYEPAVTAPTAPGGSVRVPRTQRFRDNFTVPFAIYEGDNIIDLKSALDLDDDRGHDLFKKCCVFACNSEQLNPEVQKKKRSSSPNASSSVELRNNSDSEDEEDAIPPHKAAKLFLGMYSTKLHGINCALSLWGDDSAPPLTAKQYRQLSAFLKRSAKEQIARENASPE